MMFCCHHLSQFQLSDKHEKNMSEVQHLQEQAHNKFEFTVASSALAIFIRWICKQWCWAVSQKKNTSELNRCASASCSRAPAIKCSACLQRVRLRWQNIIVLSIRQSCRAFLLEKKHVNFNMNGCISGAHGIAKTCSAYFQKTRWRRSTSTI